MDNEVKHPSMCLSAICISSLVKCLLVFFAHFLIRLIGILLLNFESSLYILDANPLLDMQFVAIFFYFIAYLFILFKEPFIGQKFNIMKTAIT